MFNDPIFRMTVEDVFAIRGRGIVVTGRIESGIIKVGDEIFIQRAGISQKSIVTGIESFRKQLKQAEAGNNVGILLADVNKEDVQRGDVLVGSHPELGWRS